MLDKNNLKHKQNPLSRDGFTSGLGVILATMGSAVGLGNIWKFPYLAGENGGAAFLVVYLLCTLLVGLPVMISEHLLGRDAKADAINTFRKLSPGRRQPWWLIGAAGVIAAFFILAFYTEVAGWVFAYIIKALGSQIFSTDPSVTEAAFTNLITNPWLSLFVQWFVLALVGFIILQGVAKGIERTTKNIIITLEFYTSTGHFSTPTCTICQQNC